MEAKLPLSILEQDCMNTAYELLSTERATLLGMTLKQIIKLRGEWLKAGKRLSDL